MDLIKHILTCGAVVATVYVISEMVVKIVSTLSFANEIKAASGQNFGDYGKRKILEKLRELK